MSKLSVSVYSDDQIGWKDESGEGFEDGGEALFLLHGLGGPAIPARVHFADGGWHFEIHGGGAAIRQVYRCYRCRDCGEVDYEEEDDAGVVHMKTKTCPKCEGRYHERPWPPGEKK